MAAAVKCVQRALGTKLVRCTARLHQRSNLACFCTTADVKGSKYLSGFDKIQELQNANQMVQRIFSLEMANERDKRRVKKDEIFDTFSENIERQIAEYTMRIKLLLEHCQANKQDKENKVFFIWLIDQRKKLLKRLRRDDFEKYLQTVEQLNIPPLADPNDPKNKYKFRKYKINVPLKKKRELHEFEYDRNY
ncbi:small ribosomal subunit protein uS15m-like [Rhopilema esculentum]|uniref:small ribosomal subunit protein uS15m-like n=1 Tax=Rhopilema esculentum TaxID=499914 RepID=UPI0031DD280D